MFRSVRFCAALALAGCAPAAVAGPLDDLDRGHRLLIEYGLQLQALVLDRNELDLQAWDDSQYTTANMWAISNIGLLGPAPAFPWSRWFGGGPLAFMLTPAQIQARIDNPENFYDLDSDELPYLPNLVSMQAGDEQNFTNPDEVAIAASIFDFWRASYPDQIHMLSQMPKNVDEWQPALDDIEPDLVAGGVYRLNDQEPNFGEPIRRGGSAQKMLLEMNQLRTACLGGHTGSGGAPIPYGVFTQTFRSTDDGDYLLTMSESQMRLQQNAAWAMGFKWICAFIYNSFTPLDQSNLRSIFFDQTLPGAPRTVSFDQIEQINFESLNLAPALVRLLSTDIRMVSGQYINPFCFLPEGGIGPCQEAIPVPETWDAWDASADPYITSITATNLGETNDGLPGDVIVGYFEPLVEAFDGPEFNNEIYFMVVNSLAFQTASTADTRQRIRLAFDFGDSGITSVQRLSRFTGQVEDVPLIPLGGNRYALELIYGGGEGDLFKFASGAPFIVANEPVDAAPVQVKLDAPPNLEVRVGDPLALVATVLGGTGDPVFEWFRDTGAKSGDSLPDPVLPDTFVIDETGFEDTGAYWVAVTIGGDTYLSNVISVSVSAALPVAPAGGLVAVLLLGVLGGLGLGAARGTNRR